MSLNKILALNSWIKSYYLPDGLLAAQKAYEKILPVIQMQQKLSSQAPPKFPQAAIPSFLSLDIATIEKIIHEKSTFLKDSAFRENLEDFKIDEIENYEVNDKEITGSSSIIIDESNAMRKLITTIYKDNSQLYVLTGRKFEELIAALLADQGFDVQLTKQTRDGGYDILAVQKLMGQYPLQFLVECKKYDSSRKVGVDIVRSFSHVISKKGANKGILVTTSYFAKGAMKEATSPYLLDFKDKDNVLEWIERFESK